MSQHREPSDYIRGVGQYHSRVPLEDHIVRGVIDERSQHPIDLIDWADEQPDVRAAVVAAVRVFLSRWLVATPQQRTAICGRAKGDSFEVIGMQLGGTPQYAEKVFKSAMKAWPELAFAFRDRLQIRSKEPT